MTMDTIERMYSHMGWADQRLLALMEREALARTQPALRLFSHILSAERVWLLRLREEDSSAQPIWPDLTLEALSDLAAMNHADYARYLGSLNEEKRVSEVSYRNQQGTLFRTRVDDILIHVATHGSYHRGQVAAVIRAAGGEPINTDYIAYVRERARGFHA